MTSPPHPDIDVEKTTGVQLGEKEGECRIVEQDDERDAVTSDRTGAADAGGTDSGDVCGIEDYCRLAEVEVDDLVGVCTSESIGGDLAGNL